MDPVTGRVVFRDEDDTHSSLDSIGHNGLQDALKSHEQYRHKLLCIPFITIHDYLFLLRSAAQVCYHDICYYELSM